MAYAQFAYQLGLCRNTIFISYSCTALILIIASWLFSVVNKRLLVVDCYIGLHHCYASVGGATEAYGSRFVYVCISLSAGLSVGRISRCSLKTKHWNKQHKQKSIFARKWIARILVIKLCSWVMAWFKLPTSVLLVIWFSVKTIMFLFNRIATCHLLHDSVALHSYVDLAKSYSSGALLWSTRPETVDTPFH